MLDSIISEFTVRSLLSNIAWALMLSALGRLTMWVFHVTKFRERWYWVAVPALVFIGLAAVHVMSIGGQDRIDIRPRIEEIAVGDASAVGSSTGASASGILIVMSVRNPGMPTILEYWRLDITMINGAELKLLPSPMNNVGMTFNGGTRTFTHADSLYLKGLQPVPRGGMVRGILAYIPGQGYTRDDILAAKHGTLHILDVSGDDHTFDVDWQKAAPGGVPVYFPELGPQQSSQPQGQQTPQ